MKIRLLILCLLTISAGILLVRTQTRLTAGRAELAGGQSRIERLHHEINETRRELAEIESAIKAQHRARRSAELAMADHKRAGEKISPEARWVQPPSTLPDWNAESPYIWISKETLAKLPVNLGPFLSNGQMPEAVAEVLAIDEETRRKLSHAASQLLRDYRALENLWARPSTNHLPGVESSSEWVHTVETQPPFEEAERLKDGFVTTLHSLLGEQRATLVLERAREWIAREFSGFAAGPKIVSVGRAKHGGYTVSISTAGTYNSHSGMASPDKFLPRHLLHHFEPLLTVEPE